MNAETFALEIVVPTLKEALAERANRRRVYVAAIITFSLADYVAKERQENLKVIHQSIRNICEPAFKVVQGICNGAKHAGNDRDPKQYFFRPGADCYVPIVAFDSPGGGWDQGRYEVPGLSVNVDGEDLFLDTCIQVFFRCICERYNEELGRVDLSFLDPMVLSEN